MKLLHWDIGPFKFQERGCGVKPKALRIYLVGVFCVLGIACAAADEEVLVPALINGSWGYMDLAGDVQIEPQYENAMMFSEGLAGVQIDGQWGYIDPGGNMVIEPRYDYAGWMNNYDFHDGMAMVEVDDLWGFIDIRGDIVVELQYEEMPWPFSDGLACVEVNRKHGFIDTSGEWVIEPVMDTWTNFSEGLAPYSEDRRTYGYIDKTGAWAIEPQFEMAGWFSEGLAPVQADGLWGYIDKTGAFAIEPQFGGHYAWEFSGGLAAVVVDDKSAAIDAVGDILFTTDYRINTPFSDGVAIVMDDEYNSAVINKDGAIVTDFGFNYIQNFKDGVALAIRAGEMCAITTDGEYLWRAPIQ